MLHIVTVILIWIVVENSAIQAQNNKHITREQAVRICREELKALGGDPVSDTIIVSPKPLTYKQFKT